MDGIRANADGSASNATAYSQSTGNLAANTGDTVHFVHPAPRPDLLTAPPPHQSSQPPSKGGAAPSTAGTGCGSNPPPHSGQLMSLSDASGLEVNSKWTSLANTKAHVLPYRGKRVYPQAAEDIRLRGDKILDDLLDILPHCNDELRDTVKYFLTDVASITVDMLEQCVRMPLRSPTPPQPTTWSSSETTNPGLRVNTQVADSTLQGQTADTVRVPASNADLPCDAPTFNHPDVLVPAMRGLQATATEAADASDVQQSTTGSCTFDMRTLPRVSDTWLDTYRGNSGHAYSCIRLRAQIHVRHCNRLCLRFCIRLRIRDRFQLGVHLCTRIRVRLRLRIRHSTCLHVCLHIIPSGEDNPTTRQLEYEDGRQHRR
jgi:hypothetical protein